MQTLRPWNGDSVGALKVGDGREFVGGRHWVTGRAAVRALQRREPRGAIAGWLQFWWEFLLGR